MEYTILGRTGLKVSVMGIGAGGPSRVGQRYGRTEAESVTIIREALDAGVNFIDTAEGYGTEGILGQAIKGFDRSHLVVSTKKSVRAGTTAQDVVQSLEASLGRLGTNHVDIYHLHGILPEQYEGLATEIIPALQSLRDQGKVRYLGITEQFNGDPQHAMLCRALQDDVWDVMMVGFNLLNQSARDRVFPQAQEQDIGTLIMFAVRLALSRPERLIEVVRELVRNGQVDGEDVDEANPLGFLIHEDGAVSVPDAAYRFCRDEPGTHVILSGTGNADHLRANLASFARPPLPRQDVQRVQHIFRRVDSISGQ